MANLSKAKQERRHHAKQIENERKVKQREVDAFDHNLQMARAEKAHEISRLDDLKSERIELEAEEKQLMREIADFEKAIERDSTMIGSLDTEIERLEQETNDKLIQLRAEQRHRSISGLGSVSSRNDVELA